LLPFELLPQLLAFLLQGLDAVDDLFESYKVEALAFDFFNGIHQILLLFGSTLHDSLNDF
jgi:hypothetical protein